MSDQEQQGKPAFEVPAYIEATDADRKAMSAVNVFKQGWAQFEVISESRDVTKNGHLQLTLQLAALDAAGEVSKRATTRLRIMPPIANRAAGVVDPPNTKNGCYFTAVTLDPSFPRYPRKVKNGVYETATGDLIDALKNEQIRTEVDNAVINTSMRWWNEPNGLVGKRFYGRVKQEQGSDGKIYTEVDRTRATAPTDDPVMVDSFTERSSGEEVPF